jgi:hypothetical protein
VTPTSVVSMSLNSQALQDSVRCSHWYAGLSPSCLKAWDVGSFLGAWHGFTMPALQNQCSGTSKQKSGNQGECPWPGSRVLARVTTGRWSYCAPGVLMLSCKAKSCPAAQKCPGTLSSPFTGLDLWMLCIRFFPSMAWRLGTPGGVHSWHWWPVHLFPPRLTGWVGFP